MLIINDKKGWYGSFSEAGKRAVKMNILLSQDYSSSMAKAKNAKKNLSKNSSLINSAFNSNENKNKPLNKKIDDTYDIFTIDEKDKIKLEDLCKGDVKPKNIRKIQLNNKKGNFRSQSTLDKSRKTNLFFYELHKKKKKKISEQENPPCTKYNPKYTSIFKRNASNLAWSTMCGRKDFASQADQHPFYIEHQNILDNMAGKAFIDMKKQPKVKTIKYKLLKRPISSYGNSSKSLNKKNISDNNSINKSNINKSNFSKSNININKSNMNYINKSNLNNLHKNKRSQSSVNPRIRRKNYSTNLRNKISCFSEENIKNYDKKKYNKKIINSKATNIDKKIFINSEINNSQNKSNTKSNDLGDIIDDNIKEIENENENEKESEDVSKDSYEIFKQEYNKEIKKRNKKKNNIVTHKEIIKAPNFKQMISRETLDKLRDDKIPVVPYLLPNFSSVRDRQIMMVVYDRNKHKINRAKSASLARIDNTFYYNPNDLLTKINNFVSSHPPNFNMMTSRPDDDDPLPSYMKQIYTRNSCYDITQLSLKLNNYKNRGFSSMNSSFWPKKSFNKIINLNLLKSKKFIDNVIGNQTDVLKQPKGLGATLKFYTRNFENILRENCLEKFDSITYKSIKREYGKQVIELIKKLKEETGNK